MKPHFLKPFIWLTVFVMLVSVACLSAAPTPTAPPPPTNPPPTNPPPTDTPKPTDTPAPTETPKPTDTPAPTDTPVPTESGAVHTLKDLQKAMIFIVAEGSWREPEGWNVNVGYSGSGFIIDPSGIAVTNNHVVTGAALLKVYVGGEDKPRNARVLAVSECSDLAVLDIEGDGYPYMEWYDQPLEVGTKVYAAGYPDGLYTLTDGIISVTEAPGETIWSSVDYVIQHSAKINPGNSGGPLVSEDGKVIGVNYAGISTSDQNFAISEDEALPIIDQLRAGKDVDTIGINGITLYGYTDPNGDPLYGIWVRSVEPGSPADKTRIQSGDILYQMAGQVLATDGTMADYCDIIRSHGPGDTVDVSVLRYDDMTYLEGQLNGRELAVAADLGGTVSGEAGNADLSTTTYSDYVTVQDDYGAIQISIPVEWSDVNGSEWVDDGKTIGAMISAAADLDKFNNTWEESGVLFGVSDDLATLGGYIQLLDIFSPYYRDNCTAEGRFDYEDEVYRGKYDLFSACGGGDNVFIVMTGVPKQDSSSMLFLLAMQITKEADYDAMTEILQSFDVVGTLP